MFMSIEIGSLYRLKSRPEEVLFVILFCEIHEFIKMGNKDSVYHFKGLTTTGEDFEYMVGESVIINTLEKVA